MGVSPDGRRAAAGGSSDGWVRVYEVASGREVRAFETGGGATFTIGYTGDGRFILGSHGDGSLRAWGADDGSSAKVLSADIGYVPTFSFSRDGWAVAYPTEEGSIAVVEIARWSRIRLLEGHEGGAVALAFHPRGRHLASLGQDGGIQFWDLGAGRKVHELATGMSGAGCRLAFTSDGHSLVVAGSDGTVRVYGRKP